MPDNEQNEKERALKTVAKSGSIIFVGIVISTFLGYLTRIILARFLGSGGMGIVYLALSISTILVNISIFGLNTAVKRYLSYYVGKENLGKVKGVITNSLKISSFLSILAAIILFLLSDWLAEVVFHKPLLSTALKIFAICIPFRTVAEIFSSSLKSFKKIKYYTYVRKVIEPFSRILSILLLVFIGFNISAGAAGYTVEFIVAAILSFYFLEKKVFPILKTKVKSISLKRKLIKFSWPLMLTGIISSFLGQIDTLMIGSLIRESEPLGIYQAALPTSRLLFMAPMTLSTLFLPIISELLSKGKEKEIKDIYKTTCKWIFYVNFPLLFLFLIFPHAIMGILFGQGFISGGTVLSVLAVGFFMSSFGNLGRNIINLKEKTKLHLLNILIVVLIDVIFNYLLIPIYGILGAGIATSISFLILTVLYIIEAYHFIGTQPLNIDFIKSLFAAVIAGSIIYWVANFWLKSLNIFIIPFLGLIFMTVYTFLLLIVKGLSQEDILILKALERKTGFKSEKLKKFIKKFT